MNLEDREDREDAENSRPCSSMSSTSTSESAIPDDEDRDECVELGRKRREQFCSTLSTYKQKKLKKKVCANSQMLQFAEKELELKERMMKQLEANSRDQAMAMSTLTSNLKAVSETMMGAMSILQQLMQAPQSTGFSGYGQYMQPSPYMPNTPRPPPHYTVSPVSTHNLTFNEDDDR